MGRPGTVSFVCALLALTLLPACGSAREPGEETQQRRGGGVALKRIGSFDAPTYVSGAPGDPHLLFVTEQAGRVKVLRGGRPAGAFLDISGLVQAGGEEGLLSIAFPPDYAQSRRFYVYYTDNAGDIRVDEFRRRSATRAARGSRRSVIHIPHPVNSNHNGGQLQFLGDLLYLGTGDGGGAGDEPGNAQDTGSLLGKLLRMDPRASGGQPYTVPSDNPFVGRTGRDEIYSYGLRNPYRFSFDTTSAAAPRIAIGDVGQDRFEELDYTTVAAANGANFGWNAFEGKSPSPAAHPIPAERRSRSWPTAAGETGAAARSSGGMWFGQAGRPRCAAATSMRTSAPVSCAASCRGCAGLAPIGAWAWTSLRPAHSGKTSVGASTSPHWKGRCTGSSCVELKSPDAPGPSSVYDPSVAMSSTTYTRTPVP